MTPIERGHSLDKGAAVGNTGTSECTGNFDGEPPERYRHWAGDGLAQPDIDSNRSGRQDAKLRIKTAKLVGIYNRACRGRTS